MSDDEHEEQIARAICPEAWEPIEKAERGGVVGRALSGETLGKLRYRRISIEAAKEALRVFNNHPDRL